MGRWIGIVAICLCASCSAPPSVSEERQITRDAGDASMPVLSRDGAALAFSAVAEGYDNAQIWITRADGSSPARPLTTGAAKNYEPEFSPDGRTIYFTSTREPQGVYRVPVSGGEAEMFLPNAVAAKISPDGKTILYGSGGNVVRRALEGGDASVVLPNVETSYAPLWAPDGARILVTTNTPQRRDPEWWIVAAAGGEPRQTSLGTDLRAQGFNYLAMNAWLAGDWLLFTGRKGETQTLWKVQLGSDGKPSGMAVRATEDGQGDSGASFGAGKLVFSRTRVDMNFWSLAIDPTGDHIEAPPERLTASPARKGQQSAAGPKLLYSAESGDRFALMLKDAAAGNEKELRDGFFAVLAPGGARYAYGEGTKEQLNVYLKSLSWWSFWSSALCTNCGMPRQFSPDGNKLLLWSETATDHRLDLFDLATHQAAPIVSAAEPLADPRLSPDGRWVSFVAQSGHQWRAFVAPVEAQKSPFASGWVPVTPISDSFFHAVWGPRGDTIYTLSSHGAGGNLRFLDALKLDPQTKQPAGPPLPVYEFHETLVPGMDPVWNNLAFEGNRLIVELGGSGSNIWMK